MIFLLALGLYGLKSAASSSLFNRIIVDLHYVNVFCLKSVFSSLIIFIVDGFDCWESRMFKVCQGIALASHYTTCLRL